MRLDFRFAGSGGQGVILMSVILAEAYGMCEGYEIAQTQSYGPEARGGACRAELVVADGDVDYVKVENIAYFVVFNDVAFKKYATDIREDTVIIADSSLVSTTLLKDYLSVYTIPATDIASSQFDVMSANMVMLGYLTAKLKNLHYESVETAVKRLVPTNSLKTNMAALKAGSERGLADGSV